MIKISRSGGSTARIYPPPPTKIFSLSSEPAIGSNCRRDREQDSPTIPQTWFFRRSFGRFDIPELSPSMFSGRSKAGTHDREDNKVEPSWHIIGSLKWAATHRQGMMLPTMLMAVARFSHDAKEIIH